MPEKSKGMTQLFMTLILIVIALALTPTIADAVAAAIVGNVTGTSATLLGLVPLFWVIAILGMGVASIYYYFR